MMAMILFLHGFLGSPNDAQLIQRFLPDHTVSAWPLGRGSNWDDEIFRVAQEMGSAATVLGYSMGARLALGLAVTDPTVVSRLVLISGNPGLTSDEARCNRRYQDLQWRQATETMPTEEFLRLWYTQSVFANEPGPLINELVAEKLGLQVYRQLEIFDRLSIAAQPNYWPALPGLNVPTLCIAGSRDPKYVAMAMDMADQLPHGEVAMIAAAGHMPHRSHSAATFRVIVEFLRKHPTP
jgi:2-succinyl-6-hydroxy-2,4-cyclohexadiene-1-carboxylate synthase